MRSKYAIPMLMLILLSFLTTFLYFSSPTSAEEVLPRILYVVGTAGSKQIFAIDRNRVFYVLELPNASYATLLHLINIVSTPYIRISKDVYVLYGKAVLLDKDATTPRFVAIATSSGELLVLNITGEYIIEQRRVFIQAEQHIDKLRVTGSHLYAKIGSELDVFPLFAKGWCRIGVLSGNATLSYVNEIEVLDFDVVKTLSTKGFEQHDVVAMVYLTKPVMVRGRAQITIYVYLRGIPVANALTKVYAAKPIFTTYTTTNAMGKAIIVVPLKPRECAYNLTIEAYYVNATTGEIQFNSIVIPKICAGQSYTVRLELNRTITNMALPEFTLMLKVFKMTKISECEKAFSNAYFTITISTPEPRSVHILGFYRKDDLYLIALSYRSYTLAQGRYVLDLVLYNNRTGELYRSYYITDVPVSTLSVSEDLKVLAAIIPPNTVVVFEKEDNRYIATFRYKLLSNAVDVRVYAGCGHNGDVYCIVCIDTQGYIYFILYGGRYGILTPIGRKYSFTLRISGGHVYFDALPRLAMIAISTRYGIYVIYDLGKHVDLLLGQDLNRLFARTLYITIGNLYLKPTLKKGVEVQGYNENERFNITIIFNNTRYSRIGSAMTLLNVIEGLYRIYIMPPHNLTPSIVGYLDILPKRLRANLTLIDRSGIIVPIRYIVTCIQDNSTLSFESTVRNSIELEVLQGMKCILKVVPQSLTLFLHNFVYSLSPYSDFNITIDFTVPNIVHLDVEPIKRLYSKEVKICLYDEQYRSVHVAQIELVGITTGSKYTLSYDPKTGCYIVTDVPYDVYLVLIGGVGRRYIPPKNTLILVNSDRISKNIILRYRPISLTIFFSEPLRVDAFVYIDNMKFFVKKGSKSVRIPALKPGKHIIKFAPLKSMKNLDIYIEYYECTSEEVILQNDTVVRLQLKPRYVNISLKIYDRLVSKLVDTIILYVDNVKYATFKQGMLVKTNLFLPLGRTNITIISLHGVYRRYVKIYNITLNTTSIKIVLRRTSVPLTFFVYNDLGEKLTGAMITAICDGETLIETSVDGKATLHVPANSHCEISVEMKGHKPYRTSLNMDTKAKQLTVVLKAEPTTIIVKYIPLMVTAAIIGSIIALILYIRKKILEHLRTTAEEFI